MPRKRKAGAEAAGRQYAEQQIESDYFQQWMYEQMVEGDRMRRADPSSVMPLETDADYQKLARNMMQQLYWDTSRDMDPREIDELTGGGSRKEFFDGFRAKLYEPETLKWVAGIVKEMDQHLRQGEQQSLPGIRARAAKEVKVVGELRMREAGVPGRAISRLPPSPPRFIPPEQRKHRIRR